MTPDIFSVESWPLVRTEEIPISGKTIVLYYSKAPFDTRADKLGKLKGKTITLGGRPFKVADMILRCMECQLKDWPIGFEGQFV